VFIDIEGGNASGKTTITKKLVETLQRYNKKVVCMESPTSPFDKSWLDIADCDLLTKYYFFRAVSQNESEKIKKLIKIYDYVILDRYLYETEAFDLTLEKLQERQNLINKHINYDDLLTPNIVFFLDVDDKERAKRIENRGNDKNKCYWERQEFQLYYNDFYRKIAKRENFFTVDTLKNNIEECVNIMLNKIGIRNTNI
jgi:thymidylate kinase